MFGTVEILTRASVIQFVGLEALTTSISDLYPAFFLVGHRRKLLLLFVCVFSFFIGLVMVTEVRLNLMW